VTGGFRVVPKIVDKYECGSYRVETWEWRSTALDCSKRITVLVPDTAVVPGAEVPVLYLLHGFGGSRQTWISSTQLLRYVQGTNLTIVLPESGRRWFINDHHGLRYEDYLVDEIVPFVDEVYVGESDRELRGIGGFSMGGAAALMQALSHPTVFSVVVSHAGAFEASLREGDPYAHLRGGRDLAIPSVEAHERVWGPVDSAVRARYDLRTLAASLVDGPKPIVYADVGTDDHQRIVGMNHRMVDTLRREDIATRFFERPGGHDLAYLDQALPFSLEFAENNIKRSGVA
jgi:putative tributyrin esterase